MSFWFFGGSIILIEGFAFDAMLGDDGWNAWEMVGNGRRARDDGKDAFRRGMMRCVAVREFDESASGDEIMGRDIVIVAEKEDEQLAW